MWVRKMEKLSSYDRELFALDLAEIGEALTGSVLSLNAAKDSDSEDIDVRGQLDEEVEEADPIATSKLVDEQQSTSSSEPALYTYLQNIGKKWTDQSN